MAPRVVAPESTLAGLVVETAAQHAPAVGRGGLVLLRTARPWEGPSTITLPNQRTARIVSAVSPLAALEAVVDRAPEEYLVVLTGLDEAALGTAVMRNAQRGRIFPLNEWAALPGLFGVKPSTDLHGVHELGDWVPGLLLRRKPVEGWPTPADNQLTARHIVVSILAEVLRIDRLSDVTLPRVIDQLDIPAVRSRWNDLTADEQRGLSRASAMRIESLVGDVLTLASASSASIVGIGLALDVLYAKDSADEDQIAARARLEGPLGMRLEAGHARELADVSRGTVTRRQALGKSIGIELQEAASLLRDGGRWPEGPARSDVLREGLTARLIAVAEASAGAISTKGTITPRGVDDAEEALAECRHHLLSADPASAEELDVAESAVRLLRWAGAADPSATTLPDAMGWYLREGAWVDRAYAAVWHGSRIEAAEEFYRHVAAGVRVRRRSIDGRAATMLTGSAPVDPGTVPVEHMLERVVVPLAGSIKGVLLIVVDGMNGAVATQIAEDLLAQDWAELIPESGAQRLTALPALPTMTTYSRTSLFSGELIAGTQAAEKKNFEAAARGVVFHKDDLRTAGGAQIAEPVRDAISNSKKKIVAVVLNHIDDTLPKTDVSAGPWGLKDIHHLRDLIDAAAVAGRTVILTSDHGHIVERGSELRSSGGSNARWRADDGTVEAGREVTISGPRVLSAGGTAVLAVDEDLRYAAKAAGYHGGAALAELTIPVLVFRRAGDDIDGWADAPPQTPAWWLERTAAVEVRSAAPRKTKTAAAPSAATLFDAPDEPTTSLTDRVLASEMYGSQKARSGRSALADARVRAILDALHAHSGRMHRDVLAQTAGIPAASFAGEFAALKRLLNVEGYDIVSIDSDDVTVRLDEDLLAEQFEVEK